MASQRERAPPAIRVGYALRCWRRSAGVVGRSGCRGRWLSLSPSELLGVGATLIAPEPCFAAAAKIRRGGSSFRDSSASGVASALSSSGSSCLQDPRCPSRDCRTRSASLGFLHGDRYDQGGIGTARRSSARRGAHSRENGNQPVAVALWRVRRSATSSIAALVGNQIQRWWRDIIEKIVRACQDGLWV